jgi:hypothetical protein
MALQFQYLQIHILKATPTYMFNAQDLGISCRLYLLIIKIEDSVGQVTQNIQLQSTIVTPDDGMSFRNIYTKSVNCFIGAT